MVRCAEIPNHAVQTSLSPLQHPRINQKLAHSLRRSPQRDAPELTPLVGESAVQTGAHIGKRGEIHTSAAGKAILAALPNEVVDDIVDARGLPQRTPNSITDRDALEEELEEIRERGYAVNKQETTKGVHAVGAVVTDSEGDPVGGLSVSGPANRMREDRIHDELPDIILAAVNELELYIAHSVEA